MPEPSDVLAYALYDRHRVMLNLKTGWNELNSGQKNHWRELAAFAIQFIGEMEDE